MTHPTINTDKLSAKFREMAIDTDRKALLMTRFTGTKQESDFSVPANCGGFGRVRHFVRGGGGAWPTNPLPIDPASSKLGLAHGEMLRAQVFQNAVCNWRCWYCFVPFNLLAGDRRYSDWLTPGQMIDLYLKEADRPQMIDLSGGQPDLTPEWVPWMMEELVQREMSDAVYLWSDDNLSNDYFWRYLTEHEIESIATYRNYGRVCCFKGFTSESFAFNTAADGALFHQQFDLFGRLKATGMDLYAYATFTTPTSENLEDDVRRFVDRLQQIAENLPLRTIPLEIAVFSPVVDRVNDSRRIAMEYQWRAITTWQEELEKRFSSELRSRPVNEVEL